MYYINALGQLVIINSRTGMQHVIKSVKEVTDGGTIYFSLF